MEKNKYVLIKLNDFAYRIRTSNDDFLMMLALVFNDTNYFIDSLKDRLLDSNSRGMVGNLCRLVKTNNDKVEISFEFDDVRAGANFIEIDRKLLLELIEKWQKLVAKRPPEIYIFQQDDQPIDMADHLPDDFLS